MSSKFRLRPDQKQALKALYHHFVIKDKMKGKYISACGTGKTVVLSHLPQLLGAKTTVFLVPSLNLVSQSWQAFDRQLEGSFDGFLICSDKNRAQTDVGTSEDLLEEVGEDELIRQLGRGEVLRDAEVIANRLDQANKSANPSIIFCTYQSSHILLEGITKSKRNNVDLLIADEAHRLASGDLKKNKQPNFPPTIALKRLPATKKIFATATPKYIEGRGVYSMGNASLFGEEAFVYTFAEALADGVVAPFDIILVEVDEDSADADEFLTRLEKKLGDFDREDKAWFNNEQVRSAILASGIAKLLSEGKIHKGLVYSSSIKRAETWSKELNETLGASESLCLSSRNSTAERVKGIEAFAAGDVKVISNCQLFGEGHDTPSLDFVAFNDPKKSVISIAQAIGRASRIPCNPVTGERETGKRSKVIIPVGKFNFNQEGTLGFEKDGTAKININELGAARTQTNPFAIVQAVLVALDSPGLVLGESISSALSSTDGKKKPPNKVGTAKAPRRFNPPKITGKEAIKGNGMSPEDFLVFLGENQEADNLEQWQGQEQAPSGEYLPSIVFPEGNETTNSELFNFIKTETVDKLLITDLQIPPNAGIWDRVQQYVENPETQVVGSPLNRLFWTSDFLRTPKTRGRLQQAALQKEKVAEIDGFPCFTGLDAKDLASPKKVQILEGYMMDALAIALYREEVGKLPSRDRMGKLVRDRNNPLPENITKAVFSALDKWEEGYYTGPNKKSARSIMQYAMKGGYEKVNLRLGHELDNREYSLTEQLQRMSTRWNVDTKQVSFSTKREQDLLRRFVIQKRTDTMSKTRHDLVSYFLPGLL